MFESVSRVRPSNLNAHDHVGCINSAPLVGVEDHTVTT